MSDQYVIGLDFGTDSVRAVLVSADGRTMASSVHWFSRWKDGLYCDPTASRFRQHIQDHLEGIEKTVAGVLRDSRIDPSKIRGICVDTTGSSPIAVSERGEPLCNLEEFKDNPNAMVVLWKDHTALNEAAEINHLAKTWGDIDFTKYEGGVYSSEWFWAKILHVIRDDGRLKEKAYTWFEHCDMITYLLVGSPDLKTFKRSRCAAGHKAMWHESWEGLPPEEFLKQLDPYLAELRGRLYTETYTSDKVAGNLSNDWAKRLGLGTDVVVSVGTFDAHAGAIGAAVEDFTLVRVMGTSTCDIMVSRSETLGDRTVKGICGQVDGSVIPGMIGLEAGQSAFGYVLAWFRDLLFWSVNYLGEEKILSNIDIDQIKESMIVRLSDLASSLPLEDDAPLALDWINGRRTPDANQALKAAIMNLNLGTKAPDIFKALVESICFGSRKIVERFAEEGVPIKSIVGVGGVAKKSPYIMQTLADVLNMPIKVAKSDQTPALGAAMYAAVASGIHSDVSTAIKKMNNGFEKTFLPDSARVAYYNNRYKKYLDLASFVESGTN
ncbi:MAG TPA: ribulokinase [Cyclobacteriaceae bacterium]|nr:ribulokinase [Cyclobacteriaceae bacterium]